MATLALALALLAPAATGAPQQTGDRELLPGVRHQTLRTEGPAAAVHVARIAAGAHVDVRVVTAHDQIAGGPQGGRELTSDLCRRAEGVVCVNGDFAECPTCGQPIGAVVRDGRALRSPHGAHEQLSMLGAGAYSLDRLQWSGRLIATYRWRNAQTAEQRVLGEDPGWRTESRELRLDALNRTRVDGATVLFTPEWAPTTTAAGGFEAVLATPHGVRPGSMPVALRGQADGDASIPLDGVVVSASGADEAALRRFVEAHQHSDAEDRSLTLETELSPGILESVGAHPVLLRDGKRQHLDGGDNKVVARHPRTLAGWTADGELLLVVVDGRRAGHSDGMTLPEAVDLLVSLGARDAVNLDGGGASTFVGPCPAGTCVLNRPSDNRERPVTSALVVVPRRRAARVASASAAAPVPPRPVPLVVQSVAEPVVEEPAPAETAPEAAPVEPAPVAAAEPTVLPPEPEAGDPIVPEWPERSLHTALPAPTVPAPTQSDVGGLAAVGVLGVIANAALAAGIHRRRLVPLLSRELSAASDALGRLRGGG